MIYNFLVDCGYKEKHLQEITEMQAMEMWLQEHGIVGYSYDIADMVTEFLWSGLIRLRNLRQIQICA